MNIEALMTKDVVTVSPELPLKQVAALLSKMRISGVPVCDPDGVVLGVISEADIIRKEQGLAPDVHGVMRWFARVFDRELDKVEAYTVREAMTSPALTVRPFEPVSKAARLMVEHRINRLPVAVEGRLVGIVTRADLVQAFHRNDGEIADQIRDEVFVRALWLGPEALDLKVDDGVVTVAGTVDTESDARVTEHLVRSVPGVIGVTTELKVRQRDDVSRRSIVEFFPR
ncbi:MAG TPA: CBS domain-containing protein [Gaiellaceae bacterium]|jgi:CBS domain-containing protein